MGSPTPRPCDTGTRADTTPISGHKLQPTVEKFVHFYAPKLSLMYGLPLEKAYEATVRSLQLLQSQTFKKDCRVWLHKSACSYDEGGESSSDAGEDCATGDVMQFKKDSRTWLHKSSARSSHRPNADHFRLESNFAANILAAKQANGRDAMRDDRRVCRLSLDREEQNDNVRLYDTSTEAPRHGCARPSVSEAEFPNETHARHEVALNRLCISNPALRSETDRRLATTDDTTNNNCRPNDVAWKLQRADRR